MTPEEFDIMVGTKRTEALDYAGTTVAAFQAVIDWATKQRDAAAEMRRAIEGISGKARDEDDDY